MWYDKFGYNLLGVLLILSGMDAQIIVWHTNTD